jgi:hypothetical protein
VPDEAALVLPFVQAVKPQQGLDRAEGGHVLRQRGQEPLVVFQVGAVCRLGGRVRQ